MLFPSTFWWDSSRMVWCTLWERSGGTAEAKLKWDLPLEQLVISRALTHLVQLVMTLAASRNSGAYWKQWETQSSRQLNHSPSYSYPQFFSALFGRSLSKTGLCLLVHATGSQRPSSVIVHPKSTTRAALCCTAYHWPLECLLWSCEKAQQPWEEPTCAEFGRYKHGFSLHFPLGTLYELSKLCQFLSAPKIMFLTCYCGSQESALEMNRDNSPKLEKNWKGKE